MRKHIGKLFFLPILMLVASCTGTHPDNFSVEDEGSSTFEHNPAVQNENTGTDSPDSIEEANKVQTPPPGAPQNTASKPSISAPDGLETAFKNHAAALYPGWNNLPTQDQEAILKEVAKVWKQFLGDKDLNSFQEGLKGKTIENLQNFLNFESWTVVALEMDYIQRFMKSDIEMYSIIHNLESCNFLFTQDLNDFFNSTGAKSNAGLQNSINDLECLRTGALRLRDKEVKIAGYYGIQNYFNPNVNYADFNPLEEHFKALPDADHKKTLPNYISHFLGTDAADPHYISINDKLTQILQAVSFSYTDEDGKHYWSFYNFEGRGSYSRGQFGAYETQNLTFVRESEIK
jgi:hypothetical protein